MDIRRKLLIAIGAGVVATPIPSFAQPSPKVWRIGVLHPQSRRTLGESDLYTLFFEALRDLGYVDGRNLVVQWQFADSDLHRLPDLGAQLVQRKVDLIVTNGTPAIRAAQQATATIPIVALTFADPVGSGFAKSLSHPGGNITGTTTLGEELEFKRLEILTEIAPSVMRIAYLVNPANPFSMRLAPVLEKAARKVNKEIVIVNVRTEDELDSAFAQMVRARAGAVMVTQDTVFLDHAQRIGALALQHKLPSMFGSAATNDDHGLVNYAQDGRQTARSAARIVGKILKGAKPADIPIEQPTHFIFVINLKIARALGLKVPPEIMVRVTRVID